MKLHHMLMAATLVASAAPAIAQPKLVSATPATDAAATDVGTVRLTFSESLAAKSSTATLIMTGMPGIANHPDMAMPGVSSAISPDGKAIVLSSARPLPAGTYRVDWTVAGADARKVMGKHAFSVR